MPRNSEPGIIHIPRLPLMSLQNWVEYIASSHMKQLEYATIYWAIWPNTTCVAPYMESLQTQPMFLVF